MSGNGTFSSNSTRRSYTSHELTYQRLGKVLAGLGYTLNKQHGSHIVFRRKGSPSLILPWRRPQDKVDRTRLAGVYQLVSGSGVATRQKLDELLSK